MPTSGRAGFARAPVCNDRSERRTFSGARMNTLAVVLAALLAVACVAVVALPFLREPESEEDALNAPDEATQRRLALVEERDRALAALRELELDHRTGKVSDEDYRVLHGSLRRQAAAALAAVPERLKQVDRSLQTEHGQSPRS
jgi:transposase